MISCPSTTWAVTRSEAFDGGPAATSDQRLVLRFNAAACLAPIAHFGPALSTGFESASQA